MKICIERSDRMGDMILTLPVIQGIKEKNPDAIIDVVASNKNIKICKLSNLINKTYEKTNNSSAFKQLTKSIRDEKYDYYFSFSPIWFGLFLGYYSKSKFKSSLILQSRYKSNMLSKLWQIIFSKIFFSQSKIVNRFKSLRKNQDIHQTKMMMEVIQNSGISLDKDNKSNFAFTNACNINKDKKV
jgi:ADP-heptose:LPS heptosyltransferase